MALPLILDAVAESDEAFKALLGGGEVARPFLQLAEEDEAVAIFGVEFGGLRVAAQRRAGIVKVGESAALAVKRCLLFRRAQASLANFRDLRLKRGVRRRRIATRGCFEGGGLARLGQGFDSLRNVFLKTLLKLRVAGMGAAVLRSCAVEEDALNALEPLAIFRRALFGLVAPKFLPQPIQEGDECDNAEIAEMKPILPTVSPPGIQSQAC